MRLYQYNGAGVRLFRVDFPTLTGLDSHAGSGGLCYGLGNQLGELKMSDDIARLDGEFARLNGALQETEHYQHDRLYALERIVMAMLQRAGAPQPYLAKSRTAVTDWPNDHAAVIRAADHLITGIPNLRK